VEVALLGLKEQFQLAHASMPCVALQIGIQQCKDLDEVCLKVEGVVQQFLQNGECLKVGVVVEEGYRKMVALLVEETYGRDFLLYKQSCLQNGFSIEDHSAK
jgi:hypothetical protein